MESSAHSTSSSSTPTLSSSSSTSIFSEASHLLNRMKSDDYDDPLLPTQDGKKQGFPKSIFFIVGNEFCERFSYYGMRTVLYLYFIDQLAMSSGTATVWYHAFTMLCYFTPILGAMLADSLLGKFKTILYVSFLYAAGNIVLSMAATPPLHFPMRAISLLGLAMIAFGTGGIKPCVSAFGGDQFDADQLRARERFFFIFYFSINAGSLISTYVTPLLRGSVQCFDSQTCFPLAFGVPAALMITSILLFVCGKPLYRIVPPQGNLVAKVVNCIGHAIKNKSKSESGKREHWLDYADSKFDKKFIGEVRATLRVMYLFIPLPFFWALYDQQGSTWTLQATQMDGQLSSSYVIQPDQMQVVNPLLILFFIPVFDSVIYPLLARFGILTRPLKRMFTGGMLAVLSFVIAALIQLKIEQSLPMIPQEGHTEITFINSMGCNIHIASNVNSNISISAQQIAKADFFIDNLSSLELSVETECKHLQQKSFSFNVSSSIAYEVFVSNVDNEIKLLKLQESRSKPKDAVGSLRIMYNVLSSSAGDFILLKNPRHTYTFEVDSPLNSTLYTNIIPGTYFIKVSNNESESSRNISLGEINISSGGVYTAAITLNSQSENTSALLVHTDVLPNSVHMLWQVPQYIVMTAGEIMFSITGLEFSYSQAPVSMKSVLTAAWLLTTAFGNLIVIIIEEIPFGSKQSSMFFIYSGAMVVVMVVFALMCRTYQYVDAGQETGNTDSEKSENVMITAKEASSPM